LAAADFGSSNGPVDIRDPWILELDGYLLEVPMIRGLSLSCLGEGA